MRCAALLLLAVIIAGPLVPHALPAFSAGVPDRPLLAPLDICHAPDSTLSSQDQNVFLHLNISELRPLVLVAFSEQVPPSLVFSPISRRNDRPPRA